MRLHIHHTTRYAYADPATFSIQHLRLTPRPDPNQQVVRWRMSTPGRPRVQQDAHGNIVHTLSLTEPHQEITILVDGEVDTADSEQLLPNDELSPLAYLADSPLATPDAAIHAFAASSRVPGNARATAMALMAAVHARIAYIPGTTAVDHTAAEVLALGSGVCQDHAHLFLAACRALDLPARYVSGYLFTDSEHAASHAWADVWLSEENGWLPLDITHNRLANGHFCRLAVGRDYLDACPVRGVRRGGSGETLQVHVVVTDSPEARQAAQQQQ